jgi:hypothetical protein
MANTFNPYPLIGAQLTKGLDAISGALKPTSTIDDLVTAIYNFIQPIYYPASGPASVPQALQVEIRSVVYNIANAYNNEALGTTIMYDQQQMSFVRMLLGLVTTNRTPINAIDSWIKDVEDNVSKTNLTIQEQTPLLLTTQMGLAVYEYWLEKVNGQSKWSPFFDKNPAINYANIPDWLVACMAGALIGANATQKGLIAPTTDIVSVNIISSLIGGLTTGAGKVIFRWVPRIQTIETEDGTFVGGFSMAIQGGLPTPELMRRNKGCIYSNNCNNGNCVRGCGSTQ